MRDLEIGHLQLISHMVHNRHAGEQEMHWDKTDKRLTSFKMVLSVVRLAPVRLLLSSMAVLYHVTD